jgi:hypothetical protein
MNPYTIVITYNDKIHIFNDILIIEKNIAENILDNAEKIKFIIKNIKLPVLKFNITIKKEEFIVFNEEINLENNTINNVKFSYEKIKDTDDIMCKYLWIYLLAY